DLTGESLSGAMASYQTIVAADGRTLGFVGVTADRRRVIDNFFCTIPSGFGFVVVLTLIFGGAGIVFLRRHLLARHALQAQLLSTLVDLELAEEVAHIGYWSSDPHTFEARWSHQMYVLFGRDPQTFAPTVTGIGSAILAPDEDRIRAEMV